MSILASSIKGKGVQSLFCSLCQPSSVASASTRALFSTSSKATDSDGEIGQRRLVEEARSSQAKRDSLAGFWKNDIEKGGIQPGSIIAQRQESIDNGLRQPLPSGKALSPGDLRKERMWPAPKNRLNRSMDAMGPNRKKALKTDYFLNLPSPDGKGVNPLNEYLNPTLLSHFVTNMGKIMGRAQTQLTWKNQRRLGKAVRRARSMGLMPYFGDVSSPTVKYAKSQKWGMAKTGKDLSEHTRGTY